MARRKARPILEDMLAYAEEARAILGERSEAANQIPSEVASHLPLDLRPAIAMRHRLIHGYDSASADIIAKTVREDFPGFVAALQSILATPLPDEDR